jgi:hypothetical protein
MNRKFIMNKMYIYSLIMVVVGRVELPIMEKKRLNEYQSNMPIRRQDPVLDFLIKIYSQYTNRELQLINRRLYNRQI